MPRKRSNNGSSNATVQKADRRQGKYWMLTIPVNGFTPYLPPQCSYIVGQLEKGEGGTGYVHWQIVVNFKIKCSRHYVREIFGPYHCELTVSQQGSEEYVWKDDTCLAESFRFKLGTPPKKRTSEKDWSRIRQEAIAGTLSNIEADVYIRYYRSLRSIASDHIRTVVHERRTRVFWGPTATGKSHTAWEQAGLDAYSKPSGTIWWDSYIDQENVVIDEFRGGVPIGELLQWLDKWPFMVQTKGSHRGVRYKRIWITSNMSPECWYPNADPLTFAALMRRLEVYEFPLPEGFTFSEF